jgi:hypothetical protein
MDGLKMADKTTRMNVIAVAQGNGSAPEVLANANAPGTGGIAISQIRFIGGAHMQGSFIDARICFNMVGSATKSCNWRSSYRTRCHFATRGSLYVCPPESDCVFETDADIDVLSLTVPAETLGVAIG